MTSHYPVAVLIGWLALALGAGLLDDPRARRLSGAGLICLGLGLGAWRVGSGGPGAPLDPPASLERGFLVVNAGWLLLGVALQGRGFALSSPGARRSPAWLALLAGTLLVGGACLEFVRAAGVASSAGAAIGLALGGALAGRLLRITASSGIGAGIGHALLGEPVPPMLAGAARPGPAVVMLAAVAAAALGAHLSLVLAGVIVGAAAAAVQARQKLPLAALLSLVALVPTYLLLAAVAGPDGLWIATLPMVPLSPAAQSLVAPALLLAGWASAGLWPFHRQPGGVLPALLGVLLVARVGVPLTPNGLEQWRPLLAPVLLLGIWHGAARRRWSAAAIGAAWLGLMSAAPSGLAGAAVLLAGALAIELPGVGSPSPNVKRAAVAVGMILGSAGGLLVLEAGLGSEVVYTALGAAGLAVIVASGASAATRRAVPPRVDSSTGPVHIAG